jgi:hypothetical protein
VSVSNPVTSRRRPISVPASRAAPVEWLDGEVVLLAPGVALALPETYGRITVKALGSGCSVSSAAGVEDFANPGASSITVSSSVALLAVGEAVTLTSAGAGEPWYTV